MEHSFNRDFSRVRIHTGGYASGLNRQLNAKAFTYGHDIYFNSGQFSPQTKTGQHLLAHELTHTIQQGNRPQGIQRWDADMYFDSDYDDYEAPICNPGKVAPCDVTVWLLSNSELIDMTVTADDYLKATSKGTCEFYDYGNLERRLYAERSDRIHAGHGWLSEHIRDKPTQLYEISQGQGMVLNVMPADLKFALDYAGDMSGKYIVTAKQFREILIKYDIPEMSPETWFQAQYGKDVIPLQLIITPPKQQSFFPSNFYNLNNYTNNPFDINNTNTGIGYGFIPGGTFSAIGGSGMYQNPYDRGILNPFSDPVYSQNVNFNNPRSVSGAQTNWRGDIVEFNSYRSSLVNTAANRNLNPFDPRGQGNFPVFDYMSRVDGKLVSVTHSLDADSVHYLTKFQRATGSVQAAKYTSALGALNQNFGVTTDSVLVNADTYLAVPTDHVDTVRANLRDPNVTGSIPHSPAKYMNLLDYYLRSSPVTINNVTVNNWNTLMTLSPADRNTVIAGLATKASDRVISNGIITPQLEKQQAFRIRYQDVPQPEFKRAAGSELLESVRLSTSGNVSTGFHPMAKSNSIRGGAIGTGLSTVINIEQILANPEDHPYPFRELAVNLSLSGSVGTGSIYLESYVNASLQNALLNRSAANLAATGSAGALSRFAFPVRGGVSMGFGGGAASAMTLASMGIDDIFFDADYSRIDYAAKTSRAFISGSVSAGAGWLAAAGTGAVLGSEVPIAGTIVGFGAGALVYWLTDNTIGEDVEGLVREGMGEYGCVGVKTPSRPSSTPSIPIDLTPALPANMG
ncbi:DUF4157 domain-containing protein [Hymenobacter volaticus]|uniref:DUF4157 domain-containing protein n=1 Tax=Hymenobacter volaticus TaxID=2932254 RepID=A0ABY4G1R9_9BACT|nr:DUF4157 domain-containing protein [Hymenobacter volaticus]UOQ64815.1 DUF4157 domain-containing protein [Hymenobacter volaticus]